MTSLAWVLVAALVAVPMTSAVAVQPPRPERYFGVVGRPCEVPDTTPGHGGFFPGVDHPSPATSRDEQLVQAYVRASVRGDRERLRRLSTRAWQGSRFAESCMAAIRAMSAACRAQPLYLLGDAEIRLSWVCGSRVPYTLFFTITEGRISNIWSMDNRAPVPVVIQGGS